MLAEPVGRPTGQDDPLAAGAAARPEIGTILQGCSPAELTCR
ncbi:hypothetical protein [Kitasatospora sp. NPDC008115]